MRRIGLMGGSFDPVHNGHLKLAREALAAGCVERVLFLPTGNPPHKLGRLAPKLDRLRMVELALEGEAGMAVCREEIDRDGVIYTVDTLKSLACALPGCRLDYLIGADTLHALGTWRQVDEVIRRCGFLVMMRSGEEESGVRALADDWRAKGARIAFLPVCKVDVSSTQIRERVKKGLPIGGLVPPSVAAYIAALGLYREGSEAR